MKWKKLEWKTRRKEKKWKINQSNAVERTKCIIASLKLIILCATECAVCVYTFLCQRKIKIKSAWKKEVGRKRALKRQTFNDHKTATIYYTNEEKKKCHTTSTLHACPSFAFCLTNIFNASSFIAKRLSWLNAF